MRFQSSIAFALIISSQIAWGQAFEEVIRATDVDQLKYLSAKWGEEYEENIALARAEAEKRGMPIRQENEDGSFMELAGITEHGELLYNTTGNLDAAKTLSTDHVWPGGSTGFALTGDTLTVGEWDAGAVRLTHQEFTNRASMGDNATSLHNHATHVGATMIAAGIDSLAKGMAYEAKLLAHDWNNDVSEMASAAANGLLISNHSYGYISGWFSGPSWWGDTTLSATEDYKFGYYVNEAKQWDEIARLAPYYLILKAAGNDRNDAASGQHTLALHSNVNSSTARPKDGGVSGYDCVLAVGNAKNIITVGAVNAIPAGYSGPSGVVMSSFSGWGPTDDGRIKPDIVANGVGVYSALSSSDNAYASWNGTSMATPNAAGSMLLLQEHYLAEHGHFMKAATLKGLVIHTADEAGSATGPDYRFGWGLMNTKRAAEHIADTSGMKDIVEASLLNNQLFSFQVTSTGSTPITATICWTDLPGEVPAYMVDPPTKMLVNDLDIRIIRDSDSTVYYPFKLNPASPASAATTGDNDVDNVEQVFIASPTSGTYTVNISHKGNILGYSQDFSLILDGGQVSSNQVPGCMATVSAFPNTQDFESFNQCSSTSGTPCPLPQSSGWHNDTINDDIDWTVYSGGTPSSGTGPGTDYDPGTSSGKFIYTEASGSGSGFPDKKAILYSSCYDLDTLVDAEVAFAYHMFGSTMGSLEIEIYNGISWESIWSTSGLQGGSWLTDTLDISAYDGQKVMFRITGITGSNYWSDIAIDAFTVQEFDICKTYSVNATSSITQGVSTFCQGDSALLTGTGGLSYQWLNNGVEMVGDTNAALNVSQSGNYAVIVTDSNACADTTTPIAITTNPLPGGSITTADSMICDGDSTMLTAPLATSYQWTKNFSILNGVTSQSIYVDELAIYGVTFTDANQCSNSDNITVFVFELVGAGFNAVPDFCDISPPYQLTEGSPSGSGGVYSGPGVSANSGNYFFDPGIAGAGNHELWYHYTDTHQCVDSSSTMVLVGACTGLEESVREEGMKLVPNPSQGLVKLEWTSVTDGPYTISVMNLQGQEVYHKEGRCKAGLNIENLNLSTLAKGSYFVQLQVSGALRNQKLILE